MPVEILYVAVPTAHWLQVQLAKFALCNTMYMIEECGIEDIRCYYNNEARVQNQTKISGYLIM